MDYRLILPPFVGAAIGWLTNYVAIKLLFRPHRPVSILGFKIQGLIPKRRKEIARSIAKTIERELLTSNDLIVTALNNMDWKDEVERSVEEVVEHRFSTGKIKNVPIIGLASEALKYHIKYLITREILRYIDKKKDTLSTKFSENIDIKEMLASRIDRLDFHKFEELLTEFIARELRYIERLGGVIGFFIGLIQSVTLYFMY